MTRKISKLGRTPVPPFTSTVNFIQKPTHASKSNPNKTGFPKQYIAFGAMFFLPLGVRVIRAESHELFFTNKVSQNSENFIPSQCCPHLNDFLDGIRCKFLRLGTFLLCFLFIWFFKRPAAPQHPPVHNGEAAGYERPDTNSLVIYRHQVDPFLKHSQRQPSNIPVCTAPLPTPASSSGLLWQPPVYI